jgi:hypothetical protein
MRKSTNKAKIDLIREAILDYRKGHMAPLTFYTIINMIVNEAVPTKEDIEWAREKLKELE